MDPSTTTTLYMMQLEHGKYYVGESKDPVKTLEEHREGLGPFWTKIHRPIRILETVSFKQKKDVTAYTKLAMHRYGVENVRGGLWEAIRLTDQDRQAIDKELASPTQCSIS